MKNRDNRPPCGHARCGKRATWVDGAGVGWCGFHRESGSTRVGRDVSAFDPWWRWASLAEEAGGAEAERWAGLEYDEWPEKDRPQL
jgi:hypothetical protein